MIGADERKELVVRSGPTKRAAVDRETAEDVT
jgi:hypothetical protein